MSDEYDELDSPEEDQPAEPADGGPTLQDLKKLRSENKSLRDRLRKTEDEVLSTRFGADIVGLIPEEVTDHERRVTLAEQYKERFGVSGEAQTDQASQEGSQEESTENERKLAAVSEGPTAASGTPVTITADQFNEMMKDPSTRGAAIMANREKRVVWNNPEAAEAASTGFRLE